MEQEEKGGVLVEQEEKGGVLVEMFKSQWLMAHVGTQSCT